MGRGRPLCIVYFSKDVSWHAPMKQNVVQLYLGYFFTGYVNKGCVELKALTQWKARLFFPNTEIETLIFLNVPIGQIIRHSYLPMHLRFISNLALLGPAKCRAQLRIRSSIFYYLHGCFSQFLTVTFHTEFLLSYLCIYLVADIWF